MNNRGKSVRQLQICPCFAIYSYLLIIPRLRPPKPFIHPSLIRHQLLMAPHLHHLPLMKHRDPVTEFAGSQAVADIHRRPVPGDIVEPLINLRLS